MPWWLCLRWLWRAFHTTASVCILTYTHIVITAPATSTLTETPCLIARPATQTLFLPHLPRARLPTLIFLTHILATPATPTSTQHFTYILATPATHKITYAHIFWRRLPRRTTDTKNENKTKKQNNNFHKVRSNASLEALPCSLHPLLLICTAQFFDLWNCCGSERHPPKNPKLRLQHTWFLESGFVTIYSRNQDIKNNNGEFAILKLL